MIKKIDGRLHYYDKNGEEIFEGDYVRNGDEKPRKVLAWETEHGAEGLGTDATNPFWIERGQAVEGEFGIYPFTDDNLAEYELCGKDGYDY